MTRNRKIVLDNRSTGAASFSSVIPPLRDGQVPARDHRRNLDPSMRGHMNNTRSWNLGKRLVRRSGQYAKPIHPAIADGDDGSARMHRA